MDYATKASLDLTEMLARKKHAVFIGWMDETKTAMGGRMLPLSDPASAD